MFNLFSTLSLVGLASFASAAPTHTHEQTGRLYARAEVYGEASGMHAHFEFIGHLDGRGTFVKITAFEGFNNDLGPFGYHVHTNPVGSDGNCAATLAHLDPLGVTESLICNPAFPEYCQEGDLSGKHGKFNKTSDGLIETFGYTDDYLRFFPPDLSILGRSIVIHASNKTRLACGNITSVLDGTANWTLHPTNIASTYVTSYPSVAPPNPPQVITPFVGTTFPGDDVLHNLPFPLANKALSLKEALNVVLENKDTQVYVNGSQITTSLPTETKSDAQPPFPGSFDNTWMR